MKRVIASILCFCLLLSSFPAAAFADDLPEDAPLEEAPLGEVIFPAADLEDVLDVQTQTLIEEEPEEETPDPSESEETEEIVEEAPVPAPEEEEETAENVLLQRIFALPSIDAFTEGCEADPTYRQSTLEELAEILVAWSALENREELTVDPMTELVFFLNPGVETIQALGEQIDRILAEEAEEDPVEAVIRILFEAVPVQEEETEAPDFDEPSVFALTAGVTGSVSFNGVASLYFPFDNAEFPDENSTVTRTERTASVLKVISPTQSDTTSGNSFRISSQLAIIKGGPQAECTAADFSGYEFCISPSSNNNGSFRVSNVINGATYFLNLSGAGWQSGTVFSTMGEDLDFECPAGTAPGCFVIKEHSFSGYLYFCPQASLAENEQYFSRSSNNNASEQHRNSMVVLQKDAANPDSFLPGYRYVTDTAQLDANGKYLIASIVSGRVYLLKPSLPDSLAGNENRSKNQAMVVSEVSVDCLTLAANDVQTIQAAPGLNVSLLTTGAPCVPEGVPNATYSRSLRQGTQLSILDASGNFENSFTVVNNDNDSYISLTVAGQNGSDPQLKIVETADSSHKLSDCLFDFIQYRNPLNNNLENRFLVTASTWDDSFYGGNSSHRVFLNFNGQGNAGNGYPSSIYPAPISFDVDNTEGFVRIYDTQGTDTASPTYTYLSYSASGAFVREGTVSDETGFKLYLFRYDNYDNKQQFHQVYNRAEIFNGGRYIITASKDQVDYVVLKPHYRTENDSIYASAAAIVRPASSDGVQPGTAFFAEATTLTITGSMITHADSPVLIHLGGKITYEISVTDRSLDYTLTAKTDQIADQTRTIAIGESCVIEGIPMYFTNGDIQPDIFWNDILTNVTVKSASRYAESYACKHNGGNKGTPAYYSGTEVPLADCLYTFTADNGQYRITSVSKPGIGLSMADGFPGSQSAAPVEILPVADGTFRLKSENTYFAFRRNDWGVFFTKPVPEAAAANQTSQDCDFLLYRPAANDAENAASIKQSPFPGYVKASSVKSGEKYLIAAEYDNHYYLLYPDSSSTNRNNHVVMANRLYLPALTALSFTGKSIGQTAASISSGSNTFTLTVHVVNKLTAATPGYFISETGFAANRPVNKVTLSVGTSYKIALDPAKQVTANAWLSSNNDLVSIDQNGTLTALALPDGQFYAKEYVGCIAQDGTPYAIEVVIIKTGVGSGNMSDYYVEEMSHTQVWYVVVEDQDKNYSKQDFHDLSEHEHLYISNSSYSSGLDFFAKADSGYALTFMSASNSDGHYRSLVPREIAADQTDYYLRGPSSQITSYGAESIKSLINTARDKDGLACTGGMGFSRPTSQVMRFVSDQLPTLEKKVLAISRDNTKLEYADGMSVQQGDIVHFMVTVRTTPSSVGAKINFSNAILTDTLPEVTLAGYSLGEGNVPVVGSGLDSLIGQNTSGQTTVNITSLMNDYGNDSSLIKLYFNYTVHLHDATDGSSDKTTHYIKNSAKLDYSYQTAFDGGALSGNADATAVLKIALSEMVGYVNLSLSGNIGANVFLKNISDSIKNDCSLVFTLNGKTYHRPLKNGVASKVDGTECLMFTIGIAPQDIVSVIEIHLSETDSDESITQTLSFKVQDYAKIVILDSAASTKLKNSLQISGRDVSFSEAYKSFENLKAMIKALLNFGAYTQKYLNPGCPDSELANFILPSAERSVSAPSALSNQDAGQPKVTVNGDCGVTFTGMALQLGSGSLGMRVYFTFDRNRFDINELKAKYSFIQQDYTGNLYMYSYAANILDDERSIDIVNPDTVSGYYICIEDITSQWLSNIFQITVTNKRDTSAVLELSPLSYLYLLKNYQGSGVTNDLKDMMYAMYAYNQAAVAYFGNGNGSGG